MGFHKLIVCVKCHNGSNKFYHLLFLIIYAVYLHIYYIYTLGFIDSTLVIYIFMHLKGVLTILLGIYTFKCSFKCGE